MKKGLMALIGVMLVGAVSIVSAQYVTIYYQSFNGSWSATSPPSGWVITDSYNGPQQSDYSDWHRGTYPRPSGGSSYNAAIYYYGSGSFNYQTDIIMSPTISCGGRTNVRLRIDHYWSRYGSAYWPYVEGSVNGGASWPYLIYRCTGSFNRNDHTLNIPWADGQSNVRIRFRGYGMPWYMNYWVFDNFIVEAMGAPTPPEIAIIDITGIPDYITGNIYYTPRSKVRNNGSKPATNVAVACSIWTHDGILEYHDERTIASLGGYSQTTVTFDDWLVMGYCSEEYRIKVSTDFDDDDPDNNYQEISAVVTEVLLTTWTFEPTDEGFTHTTYRCDRDCWEWGPPSRGSVYAGGYPGTPPTPPNCWGTEIDNYYPDYAGSRLKSPDIDLPAGSRKLRLKFQHWYYVYSYYYAGGNVKLSKDGGAFELIKPVGGYPRDLRYGCLADEPAFTGYGSGGWREVTFDVPFETPVNKAKFAWDFGSYGYNSYRYRRYWGWAVDNVRVYVRYPPVAIAGIGGLPALVGINCCYTLTTTVRNQWRESLRRVDVLRRIGRPDEGTTYESHQMIEELAKDAEQVVTFEPQWCAPPDPWITLYDSIFVGLAGMYLDTLVRYLRTGADIAAVSAQEPIDTIFINTTYYPVATIEAEIGCDVPYACTLQLKDEKGYVTYISQADGIVTGPQDQIFDSVSVTEPGYYKFTLVARYIEGVPEPNDSLDWQVLAQGIPGALDVGPTAIDMPDKAQPGDSLYPEAKVENFGKETVSFDVECTIEPGAYVETQYVNNLAPGATADLNYGLWTPPDPGEYLVTVTTKLAGDGNPENDTKEHKINVVGIAEGPVSGNFELSCIRPNPFSINTEISYKLPHSSKVSLAIYDISGKLIKTLATGTKDVGSYTAVWDGRDVSGKNVPAGIYFVKLLTPEYKATRKVVLLTR